MGEVGRFLLYLAIGGLLVGLVVAVIVGPLALIGWLIGTYGDSRLERWRLDRWHNRHRSN